MGRQQASGPPPGIFGTPTGADTWGAWAIPALAALGAAAAGGLWLAGTVSALAEGRRQPGSPLAYVKGLAAGRAPWPDAWGWAALAAAVALLAAVGMLAAHLITDRLGRRHRADQVARVPGSAP
jgi:hypothetical protein